MLYLQAGILFPRRQETEIYNIVGLAILLPFTAAYLLYRTDPRYLIGLALVLLVSAAVEDAAGNSGAANDIAIVSYYCLVAGVILMIADGYRERHRGGRLSRIAGRGIRRISKLISDGGRFQGAARELLPVASFALLSLLIMQAFLSPGYVLVTDMVFGPVVPAAGLYGIGTSLGGAAALTAFQAAAVMAVPGWAVEKLFLFLTFFLSGYSMYMFAGRKMGPARYYASFLYTVNPFLYARILAGAWALSFAYALMPLCLLAFVNLADSGGSGRWFRQAFFAASLFSLVAVFDTHTLVLLLALAVIYYAAKTVYNRGEVLKYVRGSAGPILSFAAMFALFNAYWLLFSGAASGRILGGFTFLDAIAFASQPTIYNNTMLSIAAMYGFFRTGYAYPITAYPDLIIFFLLFLFLAVFGIVSNWNSRRRGPLVATLTVGMVASIILATGISSPLTSGIYTYLFNNMPFFSGFREPQKMVAVVVLAYSYLGALGIYELESFLRSGAAVPSRGTARRFAEIAVVMLMAVALIAPFAYSYMEVDGFNGQLTNVQYPSSWYTAGNIMSQNTSDNSVIVFPWHTYMYYNWSQTKFASPFNQFFRQNLVFGGTNSYVGGEEAVQGAADLLVTQVLSQRNNVTHLGNILSLLDAKYVFLSKSADYWNYSFLYRQSDLALVLNTSECALFLNLHRVSRAYIVQQVRHFSSYAELVNLSSQVNLMDYAWIPGGQGSNGSQAGNVPLASYEENPASFSVSLPGLLGIGATNYLVFIPPAGSGVSSWSSSSGLVSYYAEQPAGNTTASLEGPLYSIYTVTGGPGQVGFHFSGFTAAAAGYAISGTAYAASAAILLVTLYPAEAANLWKRVRRLIKR